MFGCFLLAPLCPVAPVPSSYVFFAGGNIVSASDKIVSCNTVLLAYLCRNNKKPINKFMYKSILMCAALGLCSVVPGVAGRNVQPSGRFVTIDNGRFMRDGKPYYYVVGP